MERQRLRRRNNVQPETQEERHASDLSWLNDGSERPQGKEPLSHLNEGNIQKFDHDAQDVKDNEADDSEQPSCESGQSDFGTPRKAPLSVMEQELTAPNLEGFNLSLWLAESVGIIAVLLVAIWTSVYRGGFAWRSYPSLEFNWHPLLMTIGMIYMYGNGILVYRIFRGRRKRKLKIGHAFIHLMIFVLAVIALQAVFDSHNLNIPPIPNLYTLHSWIGLISVILFSCQWVSGLVSFLYPGLHVSLRASYLPVHVFFGVGGFLSAVTSALLGLLEKANWTITDYKDLPTEGLLVNFIGMALIIYAALVMFLITTPRFRRVSIPEDELLLREGIVGE